MRGRRANSVNDFRALQEEPVGGRGGVKTTNGVEREGVY